MTVQEIADDTEIASRWLGKTINSKYVVESVVGSGGTAVVYSARHRNGKRFALKMLHRELSLNLFIRQRFVREGYVANRVEHDGAVTVIDDDITDDGSVFLVMELLHGVTLERLWEGNRQRLPLDCVLAIAVQLLDVLAAAHAQSIVHRDLKPANVFITRKGLVKILDFGIARLREAGGSKTETGATLGTPLFMPPEQASGRSRDIDARTDIWAVGATMFSLLSGQFVHNGENTAQVLISVATTPSRSLATVLPEAPAAIVAIIDRALAFENDDRWESAVAMRNAMLAAQGELGLTVAPEFLGRMVSSMTPGAVNSNFQTTPTTPAPNITPRTEPLIVTPPRGPGGQALPPGASGSNVGQTKRSPPAPGSSLDPLNTSSRAVTSPTSSVTPVFRPASKTKWLVLIGLVAVAAAGAVYVKIFRPPADALEATPLPTVVGVPQLPATTATSAVAASVPPVQAPSVEVPAAVGPANSAEERSAARGTSRPVRRPPVGSKAPPNASLATSSTAEPTGTPAVTPPPPSPSTPNGEPSARRKPSTLDRTNPFGK